MCHHILFIVIAHRGQVAARRAILILFIEASMTSHRKRSDKAAAAMDGCVAVAVDILMAPAVDKYVKFHVTRFLSLASMNDIIHLEPNRCRNQVI